MKWYIDKLKKIEKIINNNTNHILTNNVATDLYEITNEIMCNIDKMKYTNFVNILIKLEKDFYEETGMTSFRSPNVFKDWLKIKTKES